MLGLIPVTGLFWQVQLQLTGVTLAAFPGVTELPREHHLGRQLRTIYLCQGQSMLEARESTRLELLHRLHHMTSWPSYMQEWT